MSVLDKLPVRPGQHVHYEDVMNKVVDDGSIQPQTPTKSTKQLPATPIIQEEKGDDHQTSSSSLDDNVIGGRSPAAAAGGSIPPPSVHDPYVSRMKAIGTHAFARHLASSSSSGSDHGAGATDDESKQMRDRLRRALEIQSEIFEMHDRLEREADPRRQRGTRTKTMEEKITTEGTDRGDVRDSRTSSTAGGTGIPASSNRKQSSSGAPGKQSQQATRSSADEGTPTKTPADTASIEQLLDAMDDEDKQMRAIVDKLSTLSDVMHEFHRIPLPTLEFPTASASAAAAAKAMAKATTTAEQQDLLRSRGTTLVINTPASVSPVSPTGARRPVASTSGQGGGATKRPPRRAWTVATPGGDGEGSIW